MTKTQYLYTHPSFHPQSLVFHPQCLPPHVTYHVNIVGLSVAGGEVKSASPAKSHKVRQPGAGQLGVRIKKTLRMTGNHGILLSH